MQVRTTKTATYFVWRLEKATKGLIRILILYPMMLITLIPSTIFNALCSINTRLENWW